MNKYRFHVLALPHVITTKEAPWCACAYNQKVRNFCKMMHSLGHEVYHYGAEGSQVDCTEHVEVISQHDREMFWPNSAERWRKVCFEIEWDIKELYWQLVNRRCIHEIEKRGRKKDFIAVIAGTCQQPVTDRFGEMLPVEYGIGYRGVYADYRVFESRSHMHRMYGALNKDPNGAYYDAVIPNYYDPAEFDVEPSQHDVGNYVLFVGRMIKRKGLACLQSLLEPLDKRGLTLVCAGQGVGREEEGCLECEDNMTLIGANLRHEGLVDFDRRRELMSRARALLAPTMYVEPFGGVAVEAQLCGCPVISTNWGAFTETVEEGMTGFRPRTLRGFVEAIDRVPELDRQYIRDRALRLYSTDNVRHQYQAYFDDLYDLWEAGAGWPNLGEMAKTAEQISV